MHSLYFLDITHSFTGVVGFFKSQYAIRKEFVSKTTRIPDVTIRAQRGRIGAESLRSSQVFAEFSGADSHCNRLLCLWSSKIIDIRLQIATFGKDAFELLWLISTNGDGDGLLPRWLHCTMQNFFHWFGSGHGSLYGDFSRWLLYPF